MAIEKERTTVIILLSVFQFSPPLFVKDLSKCFLNLRASLIDKKYNKKDIPKVIMTPLKWALKKEINYFFLRCQVRPSITLTTPGALIMSNGKGLKLNLRKSTTFYHPSNNCLTTIKK